MAPSIPSTAYSRELGEELRRLREQCTNFKGAEAAARLGWHPSKVSTIEHGKARPSEIDLVQFLTLCGKDIDYFEVFKQRYRYAFDEYIVQAADSLRTAVKAESTAAKISSYETLTPPGLLQTWAYADSLYRQTGIATEDQIPGLVQMRTDRQAVLRRHHRADCVFYVHEIALQQQVGDAQVMEDQYLRLLFNSHLVRIVPEEVVAVSAGFVLWEYEAAKSVAYSETEFSQVFVQDPAAVAKTRRHFARLAEVALDEEQTRSKLMEYIGRPRQEIDLLGRSRRTAR
ncbi:helix-turn-helix transcriptional regulator [Lentzea sp. NPDC003310]|uniref:helix-turn-helix domain-containing protein n=1 Tax=Lentzea sp. NPDC003310 TaxID=3154447 RepID=UPI00339F5A26